jgi:membrane protein DedA with SNARE-associated domain
MGQWLDGLTLWLSAHPEWLALAIFLIAFVECLAIAGLVVPGTVALFAVAVLAGRGALTLGEVLLLGYLGGLLGDAVSYFIGRHFHQGIRKLPMLRTHPQWIDSAESYFQRYGVTSLLIGRFIGPLRPMLPMVAGMFDFPLVRFLLISLLAAAGWSVAYLMPGWATGAATRLPLPEGFWPQAGVVAAGIALLIGLSVHTSWQTRDKGTRMIAAASLLMLAAVLIGWPWLSQLDQGLMALIQEHRSTVLDPILVRITKAGDFRSQLVIASAVVVILAATRQWRPALFAIGALLGAAVLNGTIKLFFARIRPEVLSTPLTTFSMPSGHTSAAFALFLTLAVLAGRGQPPRMRLTWVLLGSLPALAISISRLYLGAHWPSDVLAGALLACCTCALSLSVVQWRSRLQPLPNLTWWLLIPTCVVLLGYFATAHYDRSLAIYQYTHPQSSPDACETPLGKATADRAAVGENRTDQANSSPCN